MAQGVWVRSALVFCCEFCFAEGRRLSGLSRLLIVCLLILPRCLEGHFFVLFSGDLASFFPFTPAFLGSPACRYGFEVPFCILCCFPYLLSSHTCSLSAAAVLDIVGTLQAVAGCCTKKGERCTLKGVISTVEQQGSRARRKGCGDPKRFDCTYQLPSKEGLGIVVPQTLSLNSVFGY